MKFLPLRLLQISFFFCILTFSCASQANDTIEINQSSFVIEKADIPVATYTQSSPSRPNKPNKPKVNTTFAQEPSKSIPSLLQQKADDGKNSKKKSPKKVVPTNKNIKIDIQKFPLPPKVSNSIKEIIKESPKPSSSQKAKASQKSRSAKGSFSYLFVPLAGCEYDKDVLSKGIENYAKAFDIDIIVITGDTSRLFPPLYERIGKEYNPNFLNNKTLKNLLLLNNDLKPKINDSVYDFDDFVLTVFSLDSPSIDENNFDVGRVSKNGDKNFKTILAKLAAYSKPSVIFASPQECSHYDKVVMDIENTNNEYALNFTKDIESEGYIDMFNSIRFSAPTIGLLKPGFTYISQTRSERIDFVYAKSLIPCHTQICYLEGLSSAEPVKRYAIMGKIEY